MTEKLYGVVPPMITPFAEDDTLNEKALRNVVNFLFDHVHGYFICGTYGGGPLMSKDEKKRVLEVVAEEVKGQREVIFNVSATNTRDAVELARFAEKSGATRVASVPPYYYQQPMVNVLRYFGKLVESINLPVYVYNNPKAVGYGLTPENVVELAKVGVFGMKDSSFDAMWYDQTRRATPPEFDCVMGTEGLFLAVSVLGCQAYIPGLGNAYPDLCRKLFDQAVVEKNYPAAYETHKKVLKLRSLMSVCGPTLVGVTEMAWLRGIDAGYPRAPFARADETAREKLRKALVEAGAL
ncbi:MAG: dihydrodipicolinate synthase family protein [Anaerolineales bacterium]|jgi:dihydrodipicolinate synthase/N-acetylneuraminate lyase|nr:dihydrodipicolinate synthase family protein [Anaerolineales bacterium]